MKLYQKLQEASSEEDVKDAYRKALGRKGYQKNLIDIQTKEIWFEAKDSFRHSTYEMFTQLLHYVQDALNKGEYVPSFLSVIDTRKAAIMRTKDVLPFLEKKTIKWGKSASQYTQEALDTVSAYIGTHFVSFNIQTHEEEFISTIKEAIESGEIIRTQITPDNLKQVFDKWVELIGREIFDVNEDQYDLLFFADIMHDGTVSTHEKLPAELLHKNGKPVFQVGGKICELGHLEGYRSFWSIYQKPPKAEHRDYILERRDSLIPNDERIFKGAYYTPLHVVDKAYEKLNDVLGQNWQKNYIVWDMCCGVGNLQVKHSNHRKLFMSTLDNDDIDVMKATKTCSAATRFQYDYLNDDINDSGEIDYKITDKVPKELRQAIKEKKKILILINPPYAEATNSANASLSKKGDDTHTKEGVAETRFSSCSMEEWGKAKNELFMQFLVRIAKEIPDATIAMFSKVKYITAPTLQDFRNQWKAEYLGGFVIHSKAFDGLKGNFPIGFLIWKTKMNSNQYTNISEIQADVLNKAAKPIGEKTFYNAASDKLLTNWVDRPKTNKEKVIPLKNAISPATSTKELRGTKWSNNAVAYFNCPGNEMQQANLTALLSSGFSSGRGYFVNSKNLWETGIIYTARRIVKKTWLNDKDQFLTYRNYTDEFKVDCLIWMLFNGNNLTAGADSLEWNNKNWSIVNHFIPFTEQEVGASERFESDFLVQFLSTVKFSEEATNVLKNGKELWKSYFLHTNSRSIREKLKLNRADVGWYQIRKTIEYRNSSGDYLPVSFTPFKEAYDILTEKLQPMVYDLGFLKR